MLQNRLYILVFFLGISSFGFSKTFYDFQKTKDTISKNVLVEKILNQLKIERKHCKQEFILTKVFPNQKDETLIFIPVIYEEDDFYFVLDIHVLIVDTQTAQIKYSYFKEMAYTSDAIKLTDFSFDANTYLLSKNNPAFGLIVEYRGTSNPNPYSYKTLSLFIKEGKMLKKVLKDFEIEKFQGEWDTRCTGEFYEQKKEFSVSDKKTKGLYEIQVESKITYKKSFLNKDEECTESKTSKIRKDTLVFHNGTYLVKQSKQDLIGNGDSIDIEAFQKDLNQRFSFGKTYEKLENETIEAFVNRVLDNKSSLHHGAFQLKSFGNSIVSFASYEFNKTPIIIGLFLQETVTENNYKLVKIMEISSQSGVAPTIETVFIHESNIFEAELVVLSKEYMGKNGTQQNIYIYNDEISNNKLKLLNVYNETCDYTLIKTDEGWDVDMGEEDVERKYIKCKYSDYKSILENCTYFK